MFDRFKSPRKLKVEIENLVATCIKKSVDDPRATSTYHVNDVEEYQTQPIAAELH